MITRFRCPIGWGLRVESWELIIMITRFRCPIGWELRVESWELIIMITRFRCPIGWGLRVESWELIITRLTGVIIIFNSQFSIFNLVVSALAVFVDVEAFLLNALVNAQADRCVNHLI